jgi:hypothetical protein
MQVEVNNKDSIPLPSLGHVIFGTDQLCDVSLQSSNSEPRKIFSIINDKNSCIIEIFQDENILLNHLPIKEMAILSPGDIIHIEENQLKLINENRLPKECRTPFKLNNNTDNDHLLTSVSGLRSYNKDSFGELTIVGDQNSFTHKPRSKSDVPFSVSYVDRNLTLLCKKDENIEINGNKANYVILKNGDYISTGDAKYCVESPGTSSFSKYSPSHPRNIQLSEEYKIDIDNKNSSGFLKNNLWWITLLIGLIAIAIILYVLKNQ